ncbi:hypothetical protein [Floridanema evergladense]|uniref:Uncharacterized protein n=1 Tax=Floridaenema evergladense BLCC-F167 TaxID=3153639 RepID=A0ABV4WRU2_9CYAN
MNEAIKLIYPTLDLFLYDLREGLGQTEEEIKQNRREFWQKVYNNPQYNISGKTLDQTFLEELAKPEKAEASFVQLLEKEQVEIFELPLDGYYYPLQLGDTYALQVDCSGAYADGKEILNNTPQNIDILTQRKQTILQHLGGENVRGKIGQTWLMWTQLNQEIKEPEKLEFVAQKCYNKLFNHPDWNRDFWGKGNYLGATVFELWRFPANWENLKDESEHLQIWLFPHHIPIDTIRQTMADIYFDLIRLFHYRHKIIWSYAQSHKPKTALKNDYLFVKNSISVIVPANQQIQPTQSDLKQLETTLNNTFNTLARYAIDLDKLNAQSRTLNINIENYQERLKRLTEKDKNPQKDLSFLIEFGDFAKERYLRQVEADYTSLNTGLTLLENLIRTLEGTSNIRQTASDRTLNKTVAAAGIGLATSQVTSAIILAQPPTKNPAGVFFGSLGIGLLFGVLFFAFLRWKQR